ncbi:MAG: hypothetical protein WBD28_09975 [Candidatus Zixiibacteriota bacterium]
MKFKVFLAAILISILFSTSFASSERVNSMGRAIWLIDDLIYDLDLNPAFATSQNDYLLNSSFFFYNKDQKGHIYSPMDDFSQSCYGKKDSLQIKLLAVTPIGNSLILAIGGEFEKLDHSIRYSHFWTSEEISLRSSNRLYTLRTILAYDPDPGLSVGLDFQFMKKPHMDLFNENNWDVLSTNPISIDRVDGKKITLGLKRNKQSIEYGFSLSYLWQEQNFWQESIHWTGNLVKITFKEKFNLWQGISHFKYRISEESYLRTYLGFLGEKYEFDKLTYWPTYKIKDSTKFPSTFWGIGLVNHTGESTVVFALSGRYFKFKSNKYDPSLVSYQFSKLSIHFGIEHSLFKILSLRGGLFMWSETTERDERTTIMPAFASSYNSSQSNVLEPTFLTLGLGIKIMKNLEFDIDVANIPKSTDSEEEPFLKISTSFTY